MQCNKIAIGLVKVKSLEVGIDPRKVAEYLQLIANVGATSEYDQQPEFAVALGIYKAGLEKIRQWALAEVEILDVQEKEDGSQPPAGPPIWEV